MRIGDLARAAGVKVPTLRYWERVGLLPAAARGANGYRSYSAESLRRVRAIRWAQGLGFRLREIRSLLTRPHERLHLPLRERVRERIHEVDAELARLRTVREALALLARCECRGSCPVVRAALEGESHVEIDDRKIPVVLVPAHRRARSAER